MSRATTALAGETIVGGTPGRDRKTANVPQSAGFQSHPFCRLVRVDFGDIDELCSAVRGWDLDFRPLSRPVAGAGLGRLIQSRGDRVQFGHARFSLNLDQRGAAPRDCVTFVVLEDSVRRLWWRGYDVDRDTVLAFPVNGELHSLSGADFAVHTISIENSLCEEICADLRLGLPPSHRQPEVFTPPRAVLTSLRRALRLLADETAQPTGAAAQAIAETLVKAWSEALTSGRRGIDSRYGPDRTMRRALELFGGSNWPMLTASDLCRHAGVSERTLQNAFRQRFGLTPAAYLKARRLAAVNAILKSNEQAMPSVGDIAAQYGFWHSGQFAADYKQAFGELPSDTLRRAAPRRNGGLSI